MLSCSPVRLAWAMRRREWAVEPRGLVPEQDEEAATAEEMIVSDAGHYRDGSFNSD